MSLVPQRSTERNGRCIGGIMPHRFHDGVSKQGAYRARDRLFVGRSTAGDSLLDRCRRECVERQLDAGVVHTNDGGSTRLRKSKGRLGVAVNERLFNANAERAVLSRNGTNALGDIAKARR